MPTALEKYVRGTADHIEQAFRYRRAMGICEWSEKVRRMEGGRRFTFDFAPYQREMHEAPYDPETQMTVFMMASRLGKTETLSNINGHAICEDPRKILVMYPTISQAEKWSKETFMRELVANTPEIYDVIGDGEGKRKGGNTILHKLFPGGGLNAFGANSPGEMRRAKGNLLEADEIDAMQSQEGDEGDALEIFWVRGSEYPDTIKIAASYPSIMGRSKIHALMLQSDWRIWLCPCPHCDAEFQLTRELLKYDKDKPEDAYMQCPENGCEITESERVAMIREGRWEPTRPFTGIRGYYGSRMMSPHPPQKGFRSHLHWAAVQEMAIEMAENRNKAEQVLVNTFDGMPYVPPEMDTPEPDAIEKRAHPYLENRDPEDRVVIPKGVLVITIGADVQQDRIECEFVGYGEGGQTWGLGYHVLPGRTDEPKVWQDFDRLRVIEFWHPLGKPVKAAAVAIDSGYRPDIVCGFTKPRRGDRVYAVYGSRVLSKPIVSKPQKRGRERAEVWEVGTHEAKSLIYQRVILQRVPGGNEYPPGYMHFPQGHGYHSIYYQRLVCEQVELKKAPDGDFYEFFSNPDKLRNEPLDCRVYSMAAERMLNPDYVAIRKRLEAIKSGEKPAK